MKVYFIGAGPGDPDLLTLKAVKAIKRAGIIIYAGSLINKKVLKFSRRGVAAYDSSKMSLDEISGVMKKAKSERKTIARIHSGDPSIYGAIQEQISECRKLKIPYEVIPGVSSFLAAAAALKQELTIPEISQTVIITRLSGRTKVPKKESLKELSRIKATLVIFLSIKMIKKVVKELLCGYNKNTPAAVVYKASWPDQRIIKGTLEDIYKKIKSQKERIKKQAVIFVGDVLKQEVLQKSRLYDKDFSHTYRKK